MTYNRADALHSLTSGSQPGEEQETSLSRREVVHRLGLGAALFVSGCSAPIKEAGGIAADAEVGVQTAEGSARVKRCPKCRGQGQVHTYKGLDPTYPNCGHWQRCSGCNGTGAVPDSASTCPRCNGAGEIHNGMGLDPTYPNCMHWQVCPTCRGKGWL